MIAEYNILKNIFNEVDLIGVADEVDVKKLVYGVLKHQFDDYSAIRYDAYLRISEGIIKNKQLLSLDLKESPTEEVKTSKKLETYSSDYEIIHSILAKYFPNISDLNEAVLDQTIKRLIKVVDRYKFKDEVKFEVFQLIVKFWGEDAAIKNDRYYIIANEVLEAHKIIIK